jgi:hypothetical protein
LGGCDATRQQHYRGECAKLHRCAANGCHDLPQRTNVRQPF